MRNTLITAQKKKVNVSISAVAYIAYIYSTYVFKEGYLELFVFQYIWISIIYLISLKHVSESAQNIGDSTQF